MAARTRVKQTSSIALLPDDIRETLDGMVKDGRVTIDTMVEHLRSLGATVSRSAVGRYSHAMEKQLQNYREAQAMSSLWLKDLDLGSNDIGRMLGQMARTIAFQTMSKMGDGAPPEELVQIARAIKDLESAAKANMETRGKIRAELQAELAERAQSAAAEVKKVTANAGLTEEAERHIREIVLGVVS